MSEAWPFADLLPLRYRVILADPPWAWEAYSEKGEAKSPSAQYDLMTTDQLCQLPVGHLAAGDCILAMWATFPRLPDALRVMASWGFEYKTGGAWAKQSSTGASWAFGTGYKLRSAAELFLIGEIGTARQRSKSERNLIVAPTRGHSRKPDDLHASLERMFDGPYLELFARQRRPLWDAWGNQLERFEPLAAIGKGGQD